MLKEPLNEAAKIIEKERRKKERGSVSNMVLSEEMVILILVQFNMKFPQCPAKSYSGNCWGGTGARKYLLFCQLRLCFEGGRA